MQWVFETLGIDKQADASAVRKAYAKAIKQCDQATEADRFQRIRQAYEFALQWARQRETMVPAIPATPSPNVPTPTAQQSDPPELTAQQPAPQQPNAAPSVEPLLFTAQPLIPRPEQQPYARPAGASPAAFCPSAPQPIAPQSPPRPSAPWQATRSPLEPSPLRPNPVVPPPTGSPPVVRVEPFNANDQKSKPDVNPSLGDALLGDDAQASAKAVLREFLIEVRKPNVVSVASVLTRYANDARLTSLDAKAEFEQALLLHIFAGPVDVPLLDAACDLFAWETSHRHFDRIRPDLVMRMMRQQSLRHVLDASKPEDRQDLELSVHIYKKAIESKPEARVEPWQIVNANKLLERFGAFKQELGERYDWVAFDWWREKLTGNPTLLASYQENRPAQLAQPQPAAHRRSQQTSRRRVSGLLFLWPILAIIGAIAGHSPSPTPSYDPGAYTSPTRAYTAPTHVNYQRPPAPPASLTKDAYLMDIDALRHAADQGNPQAQSYLGTRYENGTGVSQNAQTAAYWYRRAAERGFTEAQFRLGELYQKGSGVPRNSLLAVEWLQKAATGGHAQAQNNLAELYARGVGVKQNYQAAARWWQQAAFHNIPSAETGLGWLYETGHGVPRDAKTAVDWYRKAAAQGDMTGQADLGLMYERGAGVPTDPVIADALLSVATQHLDIYKQSRNPLWADCDRIEAKFTPAQHSAASQIVRDLSSSPNNFLAILDAAARFRHPM